MAGPKPLICIGGTLVLLCVGLLFLLGVIMNPGEKAVIDFCNDLKARTTRLDLLMQQENLLLIHPGEDTAKLILRGQGAAAAYKDSPKSVIFILSSWTAHGRYCMISIVIAFEGYLAWEVRYL